jgi:hypothetical protein
LQLLPHWLPNRSSRPIKVDLSRQGATFAFVLSAAIKGMKSLRLMIYGLLLKIKLTKQIRICFAIIALKGLSSFKLQQISF